MSLALLALESFLFLAVDTLVREDLPHGSASACRWYTLWMRFGQSRMVHLRRRPGPASPTGGQHTYGRIGLGYSDGSHHLCRLILGHSLDSPPPPQVRDTAPSL